jgi:hypothetical protein
MAAKSISSVPAFWWTTAAASTISRVASLGDAAPFEANAHTPGSLPNRAIGRLSNASGENVSDRACATIIGTPELKSVLQAQRDRLSELEKATCQIVPCVFVHNDGTTIRNFRYAWDRACHTADVPGPLPARLSAHGRS